MFLYLSAIFWTLGYDTIYGAQDMSDDEIIGLKSTSIKFKNNIKFFLTSCYLISSIIIIYLLKDSLSLNISILLLFMFLITLVYQILRFNQNKPIVCLKMFKVNNLSGFLLFLTIFTINNFE